jgi:hypothetical protein
MKSTALMKQSELLSIGRRTILKSLALQAAALGVGFSPSIAISNERIEMDNKMGFDELIRTLRSMEKKVCDAAAQKMETSLASNSALSLHLRSAGLDLSDAMNLAEALRILSDAPDSARLSSFSVSYNRELGDSGTVALAQALPHTVRDIGFVGRDMGDEGALALLEWAKKSSSVKMICIEQNNFSADTRSLYQQYSQSNPSATVIF